MSRHANLSLYLHLAGILVLIGLAIAAGLYLGEKSVDVEEAGPGEDQALEAESAESPDAAGQGAPPLYFFANLRSGAGQAVVAEEIAMAADAGVHQYVIPVALPWAGDMDAFLGPLEILTEIDPEASFLVYVTLDPPAAWLEAHPNEVAQAAAMGPAYPSMASEVWLRDTEAALEALVGAVQTSYGERVQGYVLACLDSGHWHRAGGYDTSPVNVEAFRRWLTKRYNEDYALQKAWGDPDASLDAAAIPEKPDASMSEVFFKLPEMRRHVDFLEFTSESTANAIAGIAAHIKGIAGEQAEVLAPYGFTYELTANDAGHFALARLLDSEIDGFVSPVSYFDRGLGGVGGMMGPVDSVLAHGKEWRLIDDTRTGIARDPVTGEISRPKALRAEDVYSVQQRNFAAAAAHGLGLYWADADGLGCLHDEEMWQRFGAMWTTYRKLDAEKAAHGEDMRPYPSGPVLAVVVDEASRPYMRCDKKLSGQLLTRSRDCALRAGVPVKFYLLSDVVEGKLPKASVYLFLNAFHLTAEDRARLHGVLQVNRAAAIWMYAPGYIDERASVDNICATTRMQVKAFEGVAQSGSVCLLAGKWIAKDEDFGSARNWRPLFYVDDPNVDVIANYRASGKASVAVAFFQEGWTSIYCAEPGITPGLLRELLSILELHVYFQDTAPRVMDATYFGPGLIAIHAQQAGERVVHLDRVCDIQDLLAPAIGWRRKRTFVVPLKAGETRLLKLTPIEEQQFENELGAQPAKLSP